MLRRLLPTLVGLLLGLVALVVGLVGLERIFVAERDDARAELRARRRALEQYALEAFKKSARERLMAAAGPLRRAAEDPLAPADGFVLVQGGEQRLPRRFGAAPSRRDEPGPLEELRGRPLYDALARAGASGRLPADEPWAERLALASSFRGALGRRDRAAIERTFRAFLAHRASFRLSAEQDLPLTLFLVEELAAKSTPSPELLVLLLREGLLGPQGIAVEGLQRQLLLRRERFTHGELLFFCGRLLDLSRKSQVPWKDLEQRCAEGPGPLLALPSPLTEPSLVGEHYLEPDGDDRVRGVRLHPDELSRGVQHEMRERGLVGPDDQVRLSGFDAVVPLARLPLSVESPQWARAETAITRRFGLKSALVGACGALALVIALLAVLLQLRRQRYLELKSDFVATVSHELKTPLASVRVMAETLERRLDPSGPARDYPARIVREVDGLSLLVENILSFNRLDKSRWVARVEEVALDGLGEALEEAAKAPGGVPVELDWRGLKGLVVRGDRELLRLLFVNLVRNACRYNERAPVRVEVVSRREPAGLWLSVTDNGVGIPPAEHEAVFREFHRVPLASGRGASGTGLGLAICRRVMDLHQGVIRVARSSAEGTTFELCFPEARVVAPRRSSALAVEPVP